MAEPNSTYQTYSSKVGLLFIFNIIVGTGALALPKSFQVAGYGASVILIHISCLASFICATFIVESMAVANAAILRKKRRGCEVEEDADFSEVYSIKQRTEISEMAKLFLNHTGLVFSYLILALYLFGDLTIYCTTVSKSIMNIVCDSVTGNFTENDPCWRKNAINFNRNNAYRMAILLFTTIITPMVLMGITRTKYLQISTSLSRWAAFVLMIMLAVISLFKDGVEASPHFFEINGFGSLFGTTVYAFMCHHSLPGIVTPMRQKRNVIAGIGVVYIIILLFYITLSLTGSYAFRKVFDVYTLNFLHDEDAQSLLYKILHYFLALFPVFTLSSNYPIVANTLANNLYVLFESLLPSPVSEERQSLLSSAVDSELSPPSPLIERRKKFTRGCCIFSVIAIPACISFFTDNVLLLASLTGSYPGVGVQYLIPSGIFCRYNRREFGTPVPAESSSPFKSMFWPYAMFAWSALAIGMVTANFLRLI
ncbi:unnamed protein product [Enterobius vermicularis]|uniref:Aa_trans domain-containing protein n=1 Tax=Enterobius vermicularis TaxID=51028 RepID=A0A0N4USE5_ENTVE|nr:unnamed protein product [Enterobius vermicularis]